MIKQPMIKTRTIALLLIALFVIPTALSAHTAAAQTTSDWKLDLTFQANNGTAIKGDSQPTFSPFDIITLAATLTNGNMSAPQGSTVVFNVKGPSTASNPTETIISAVTDNKSSASFVFRIPMEDKEKTVIGKWQVYANVKTPNGTLKQTATFQIAWPIQIVSFEILGSAGQKQSAFKLGDLAKASIVFGGNQTQITKINLNIQDSAGNIINQTQIQNNQLNSTSQNFMYEFKVPESTAYGVATANLSIFSGSYQNIDIPACEHKIVYFSIGNETTTIPNPTPTVTPTPTPFTENTISLFSWLLVATGFFTFTILIVFLRRKIIPKTNMPTLPPLTTQTLDATTPIAASESEKLDSSMEHVQAILDQNIEKKTDIGQSLQQETIISHFSQIAVTTKKIQELQMTLKVEKEQLSKDIKELNRTMDEQEKTIKSYYDALRKEIRKVGKVVEDDSTVEEDNKK